MHILRALLYVSKVTLMTSALLLGLAWSVTAAEDETYDKILLPFDPLLGSVDEPTSPVALKSIKSVYLGSQDPLTVTIRIINIVLTFLGTAFLILLLYAGFKWAWARGNSEEIEKAKTVLIRALIGFVIILLAMSTSIAVFMLTRGLTAPGTPGLVTF